MALPFPTTLVASSNPVGSCRTVTTGDVHFEVPVRVIGMLTPFQLASVFGEVGAGAGTDVSREAPGHAATLDDAALRVAALWDTALSVAAPGGAALERAKVRPVVEPAPWSSQHRGRAGPVVEPAPLARRYRGRGGRGEEEHGEVAG